MYGIALIDFYISLCYLGHASIHPALMFSPFNGTEHPSLTLVQLLGILAVLFGTYLRLLCFRTLGQFFTFELAIREGHKLCTHGPYSIVRHPSYTAVFTINAGVGLVFFGHGSAWWAYGLGDTLIGGGLWYFWAVSQLLGVASIFGRMKAEDKALKDNFGQEWVRWYRKVPFNLIPYVY